MRGDDSLLAKAVQFEKVFQDSVSLTDIGARCTDLRTTGCILAWMLINAEGLTLTKQRTVFDLFFTSGAQLRARPRGVALPISVGDLRKLVSTVRGRSLDEVTSKEFSDLWGRDAWMYSAFHACNSMYGHSGPIPEGKWRKAELRVVMAVRSNVERLLHHGRVHVSWTPEAEAELRSKKVNYQGEEMGTCHRLTLEQVLPALPPKEHRGKNQGD